MPKANKSSASSGTRKKHAKKSTKDDEADGPTQQQPAQRGQKKLTKAQKKLPKVKQYIPPPKPPAPPIPDPLDGQGLARTLPAELVVVLRRLGKKDEVTRRKGLEELREWVSGLKEGDEVEQELRETALLSAVPVWVSNIFDRTDDSYIISPAFYNPLSTVPSLFNFSPNFSISPLLAQLSSTPFLSVSYLVPKIEMFSDLGSSQHWKMGEEAE